MNTVPERSLPFDVSFLEEVAASCPTPFHIYDEAAIRDHARRFQGAFSWVPGGFCNYYAVKALPNPAILAILRDEGMGFDCSSGTELTLMERLGIRGEDIIFTSNNTPAEEFRQARDLGAIINLDDLSHVDFLAREAGMPELICLRYNPGSLKEGNAIIGTPREAKYGFTREQLFEGYRRARDLGARRFGLHTMVASNELNPDYFVETARILFELVVELKAGLGIDIEFVNLGGGIGIPYRPEQKAVDYQILSRGIETAYQEIIVSAGLDPVRVVTENGRVVTGPYGWLVTRVRHKKETYKRYLGVDATMADLMRPGMYGAYHHITVPGKALPEKSLLEGTPEQGPEKTGSAPVNVWDVTGSLCENNDKFALDRELPEVEVGDLLVIHDTGAHGHAMGFNYNGKPRCAEVLLRSDRSVRLIRRAETVDDVLQTILWDAVP
ncbi:diaminopimelate decarboxylase [Alkalispirochaeta sphaeroplastigenens]|uniref:Diaminopimelate decarboxylase n=1 Tax=Alkalispirochaeta sphaeroplastigenens TaxID=1187066 RepID=A0A2S4JRA5_9SPIO|nr:diaminopimelate decarboxylase [Alkalispirochaeta sphaeroplastigenens]POR02069.1 diaminopimelate decarboxylase [Alkalispirochaeta sphaeroplastigenens]